MSQNQRVKAWVTLWSRTQGPSCLPVLQPFWGKGKNYGLKLLIHIEGLDGLLLLSSQITCIHFEL
jgi:hypothetical protein